MTDEFRVPDGFRVETHERLFCDDDGPAFWLRRFHYPTATMKRGYLSDGRWTVCRARGAFEHLYARPATDPLGGEPRWPYEWLLRAPYSYATPDDAIEAAIGAEREWRESGKAEKYQE